MNRLLRGFTWLMGTNWPVYAAAIVGVNTIGAVAVMSFVRWLLPIAEIREFTSDIPHLWAVGVAYVVFAVIVGSLVTVRLFRPILDWQRNPDAHDPIMIRNLVLRIPFYQAAVAALVWAIGIIIAVVVAGRAVGPGGGPIYHPDGDDGGVVDLPGFRPYGAPHRLPGAGAAFGGFHP